jgi:hypothetical protein
MIVERHEGELSAAPATAQWPARRRGLPMLLGLLLLSVALSPCAFAEDGASIVARVKDSANQLALYLDFTAKAGTKPDFSIPPASDLFDRVFDVRQLAALPPPQAGDLPWLLDWSTAANRLAKAMLYFDINPSANPADDQAAMRRNMPDNQYYKATAFDFMIRITERVAATVALAKSESAKSEAVAKNEQTHPARAGTRRRHPQIARRLPQRDLWPAGYNCGWFGDRDCVPYWRNAREYVPWPRW